MTTSIPTRLRLTNRVVDDLVGLPPEQRARRYWDTSVPELYLQFSRAGTPSFVLRYTKLDGSDGDYAIGKADRVTIDSARAVAKAALNDLEAHDVDPVEARRRLRLDARVPKLTTFGDIMEDYIESKSTLRPGAAEHDDVYYLHRYVYPELGARKFETITVQCVLDLLTSIKNQIAARNCRKGANGKTTANVCHRAIKRVYRRAVNKEIASRNPGDFPCLFPIRRAKRRGRLDEGRFNLFCGVLVQRCQQKSWRRIPLAILLYMLTLQRPIDIARAKRDHFDLNRRIWIIPNDYTKTGYPYHIPLSEQALRLIRIAMAMSDSQYLFPGAQPGRHLNEQSLSAAWARYRNEIIASGVLDDRDIELYDCRRYGRTQVRKKLGFANEVAEAVINHVGEDHSPSQLYDVGEMLPDMAQAHAAWSAEVDCLTHGRLSALLDRLEDEAD